MGQFQHTHPLAITKLYIERNIILHHGWNFSSRVGTLSFNTGNSLGSVVFRSLSHFFVACVLRKGGRETLNTWLYLIIAIAYLVIVMDRQFWVMDIVALSVKGHGLLSVAQRSRRSRYRQVMVVIRLSLLLRSICRCCLFWSSRAVARGLSGLLRLHDILSLLFYFVVLLGSWPAELL